MSCGVLVSLICLAAAGGCGGPTHPGVPEDAVELEIRRLEGLSGFPRDERTRLVILDTAAWKQLSGSSTPPVDFSSEILLLVTMGVQPTAGYDITIRNVYVSQQELFVVVLEETPDLSCGALEILTAPWDAVGVARDGWSGSNFLESTDVVKCP